MFCLKIAVMMCGSAPEVEWAHAEHAIVAPSFAGKGTEVAVLVGREAESWKNEAQATHTYKHLFTPHPSTSHSSDRSILPGRNLVLAKIGRKSQRLEYRCHAFVLLRK